MNKEINNRIREEFYKFCDDNGFNPLRSECADWWLSKIAELLKSQKEEDKLDHDPKDGWCCACERDIAVLEEKLKSQKESLVEEIEKMYWKPLQGEDRRAEGFNAALDKITFLIKQSN